MLQRAMPKRCTLSGKSNTWPQPAVQHVGRESEPTKMRQSKARVEAQSQVESLKQQVETLAAEKERLLKAVVEEAQHRGQAMSDSFKVSQLEKQQRVIGYVAAGRVSEAITEILTPLPVLFGIDVRFADDKSRIAAEDELLAGLKKKLSEHLALLKVDRKTTEDS